MQSTPVPIPNRTPLREYLFAAISDAIVRQELPPGERLNDSALAKRFGASRTPTREALVRLVDCGFLESDPGHGFRVVPLSREEAEDVYELLSLLELHAFERCPACDPERAAALHTLISDARSKSGGTMGAIQLDAAWHAALLRGSGNQRLRATLDGLRQLALRYDAAYFMNETWTDRSLEEHQAITDAFER
ncbi:MAG: GntR family transcriptional regulator, partial [Planctomycetota bacterium]